MQQFIGDIDFDDDFDVGDTQVSATLFLIQQSFMFNACSFFTAVAQRDGGYCAVYLGQIIVEGCIM